ncbi:unnamed protein product [Cyprideis torosa]|uniref:Uncharacterized protein n=1 Tax=Cyprideis torosa TaxID=163714 RepID=A0A7R8W4T7_9CRUS|nr:unnamed protein product [Cyprideis torosa]CAG0882179.1 unnamed protein product [Cyprideis torosa]
MENTFKIASDGRPGASDENLSGLMSPGFMFGETSCSPPKFATLEEIMKAANSLENMALAHEIAVNPQFKLEKPEVNEGTAVTPEQKLHARVHKEMHQAFWDLLRNDLSSDPPRYDQAISLLAEIKDAFVKNGIVPRKNGARASVESKLDLELIEQQAKGGTLKLSEYLRFVATTMAAFCAPVRDEAVKDVLDSLDLVGSDVSELVSPFRAIMELLVLMKLDLANVAIAQIRPHIQAQSAEYERKKFLEFVDTVPAALDSTESWLKRSLMNLKEATNDEVLTEAYMEILSWNPTHAFPEPLAVDLERFTGVRSASQKLTLTAACILISLSGPGACVQSLSALRESLARKIQVLLTSPHEEVAKDLEGIAEVVCKEIGLFRAQHGHGKMTSEEELALKQQIRELASAEHPVRKLVRRRLLDFLRLATNPTPTPQSNASVPPGLTSVSSDLMFLAVTFSRLVAHNKRVFKQIYSSILEKARQDLTPQSSSS